MIITMGDFLAFGARDIVGETDLNGKDYEAILLVAHPNRPLKVASTFSTVLSNAFKYDAGLKTEIGVLPLNDNPATALVYSPTGCIDPDYDDVRIIKIATTKGVKRALMLGLKKLLLVVEEFDEFENAQLVAVLAALEALYTPIQERERNPSNSPKLQRLGVYTGNPEKTKETVRLATILDGGRHAARDIGGGDPERMTPINIQKYVEGMFANTSIKMTIIDDPEIIKKEYPCFACVDRGVQERHRGRIIYLEYNPKKEVKQTLMLVGKGITFDSGGLDIKVSGNMMGMSRDKCGTAAVAGFMKIVDGLQPPHTRVIGGLCISRNSIGSNAYVPDEIIISRAKAAIRITNTDAEGRMVMADVLCKMKEIAVDAVNPHLFTLATLTGHAVLSVGPGFSIVMDNGPARKAGVSTKLQEYGEKIGDPFEISIIRKEDFEFHKGKTEGEEVIQAKNAASVFTHRGHQGPGAFLVMSSGLDKHGSGSEKPIKYSHIDISPAASIDYPRPPTGAPILGLINAYIFN